jgi:uncharacterized membrane protein YdbT with pleckstrin-like domain
MSYVDRNLLSGESVMYRTRLHWKVYALPGLIVLFLLLPSALLALASGVPALALIPAGVAIVVLGVADIQRRSSEFAVTNRRVVIKLGVLNTRSIELLLTKVEGIEVTQTLPGRMFGYGHIIVTGSGGTRETFAGIQSPLKFRQAVQAATDARRD